MLTILENKYLKCAMISKKQLLPQTSNIAYLTANICVLLKIYHYFYQKKQKLLKKKGFKTVHFLKYAFQKQFKLFKKMHSKVVKN